MSAKKRSTLDVLGIPKEIGVLLLTIVLILAASPYLGGTDFGIFKVPDLSSRATEVLRYLGPVLLILAFALFIPYWQIKVRQAVSRALSVDTDSKYQLQSIVDIMRVEAATHGIHIDGIRIDDRFHINDLERMCAKTWSPEKSPEEVHEVLKAARAKAFSRKYADPREDEKLVNVSEIKIAGLKTWETYLTELLRDRGVKDLNQVDILYVGIGNGHSDEPFLSGIHSFRGVDISEEALRYARKKYPQMTPAVCAAEDLDVIPNNSVDLYLSLRTYQSTLFDRRGSLHEAYRVLRSGGMIVLSVPIMYLRKDGQVLQGLIPRGSSEPSLAYARQSVARISEYLTILNFREVETDERSPFEIYLSARR